MARKIDYVISPHADSDTNSKPNGVTVYGVNEGADAFEPLFYMESRQDAEKIIKKLCQACQTSTCPDWKREITACYSVVDHG
jgi:N-acetylmuramoyl-L-alanine amidase